MLSIATCWTSACNFPWLLCTPVLSDFVGTHHVIFHAACYSPVGQALLRVPFHGVSMIHVLFIRHVWKQAIWLPLNSPSLAEIRTWDPSNYNLELYGLILKVITIILMRPNQRLNDARDRSANGPASGVFKFLIKIKCTF